MQFHFRRARPRATGGGGQSVSVRTTDDMVVSRSVFSGGAMVVCGLLLVAAVGAQQSPQPSNGRCPTSIKAPEKIEKTIEVCQEEIKQAIVQEVLGELIARKAAEQAAILAANQSDQQSVSRRVRREAFSEDERQIAGCLLQCVYRKVKAVDVNGFPTLEGLIRLYTEGVTDKSYFIATARASQFCLAKAHKRRSDVARDGKVVCDVAYEMFECVTNQLEQYCGTAV